MLPSAKRVISFALAFVLLSSVLLPGMTGEAQALTYNGSASYESGKFYRALTEVTLTGDPRTDLVNIARSQVGYQEGGSQNQLSGEVLGSLNFTEYGRWYGAQDMWCAMFASWCANVAGISTDVVPSHAYTPNGLKWFKDRGRAVSRAKVEAGEYTPQAGDLIYFKSSRNKNTTNHVGIVTGYSGGRVYVIEGNTSSAGNSTNGGTVTEKSYRISNTYIVYVCSPDYERSGTRVALQEPTVKVTKPQTTQTTQKTPTSAQIKQLRNAICILETGGETTYDQINVHSGNAITIGSGQWYGVDAQKVLVRIRTEDPGAFAKLDTAGIGADLDTQNWNTYRISAYSEKALCIRSILSSEAGVRVQEKLLSQEAKASLQAAIKLGVKDADAMLLCAGVYHLAGAGTVRQILAQVQGNPTADTILEAVGNEDFAHLQASVAILYDYLNK